MIKMLIMDVDGTLTDGKLYISSKGEVCKAFNSKDGYAIKEVLPKYGIVPVIITGRCSEIVIKRSIELNIIEVHQGVHDKMGKLVEVAKKYNLNIKEIAYIGDDTNDLSCLLSCGKSGCPADAIAQVKSAVDFISLRNGGDGAVRDFIEWLIICND